MSPRFASITTSSPASRAAFERPARTLMPSGPCASKKAVCGLMAGTLPCGLVNAGHAEILDGANRGRASGTGRIAEKGGDHSRMRIDAHA